MPRPKNIDLSELEISKVVENVVEYKDCLGVSFVLNTAFSTQQIDTLTSFYKFQVSNDGLELKRSVKNSWKGLVMMLTSLCYCRYGDKVVARIWDCVNHTKLKSRWRLQVDFSYEAFIDDAERAEIQRKAIVPLSLEEFATAYQDREKFNEEHQKKKLQVWESLLMSREPDPNFEEVPAPNTWRPCYMSGHYEPRDIIFYLKIFSQLLDLDTKHSKIETVYSKTIPHEYTVSPAKYHRQ